MPKFRRNPMFSHQRNALSRNKLSPRPFHSAQLVSSTHNKHQDTDMDTTQVMVTEAHMATVLLVAHTVTADTTDIADITDNTTAATTTISHQATTRASSLLFNHRSTPQMLL